MIWVCLKVGHPPIYAHSEEGNMIPPWELELPYCQTRCCPKICDVNSVIYFVAMINSSIPSLLVGRTLGMLECF